MRTFCYAHGIVNSGCSICLQDTFPQISQYELRRLNAEQALREGQELERRLTDVLTLDPPAWKRPLVWSAGA